MTRFPYRTLLVTSGATGIGAATVRGAHTEGASFVIADAVRVQCSRQISASFVNGAVIPADEGFMAGKGH